MRKHMGIKEDRHQLFTEWSTAIKEKDWDNCDITAELLLHTLPRDSEQRQSLGYTIGIIQERYKQESMLLQKIISTQNNPFQKEQLKNKKMELDEWRVKEVHNVFLQAFMHDSLIKKD